MPEITTITAAEFVEMQGWDRRNPPSPLTAAVADLAPGTALKTECIWNHTGKAKCCSGATCVYGYAKRHGFKVRTRCKDGILYVLRLEAPDA